MARTRRNEDAALIPARLVFRRLVLAYAAATVLASAWIGSSVTSMAPPTRFPVPSQGGVLSATSPPTSIPTPSTFRISPAGDIVLEVDGFGDLTTEAFDVEPGWRVVWQADGKRFAYGVHGAQDLGTVVSKAAPSNGSNAFAPAGTFTIEIDADGHWWVMVLQGGS